MSRSDARKVKRAGNRADDFDDVDLVGRHRVFGQFDPRQRQQIVDQPGHTARLLLHDWQETFLRLGIVRRRSGQRFQETQEDRQRRAQLVAGVGDEVGAQLLRALDLCQVGHRHQRRRVAPAKARQPPDPCAQMPVDRAGGGPEGKIDHLARAGCKHPVDGLAHGLTVNNLREPAVDSVAEQRPRGRVAAHDRPRVVDDQDRFRVQIPDCVGAHQLRLQHTQPVDQHADHVRRDVAPRGSDDRSAGNTVKWSVEPERLTLERPFIQGGR